MSYLRYFEKFGTLSYDCFSVEAVGPRFGGLGTVGFFGDWLVFAIFRNRFGRADSFPPCEGWGFFFRQCLQGSFSIPPPPRVDGVLDNYWERFKFTFFGVP